MLELPSALQRARELHLFRTPLWQSKETAAAPGAGGLPRRLTPRVSRAPPGAAKWAGLSLRTAAHARKAAVILCLPLAFARRAFCLHGLPCGAAIATLRPHRRCWASGVR